MRGLVLNLGLKSVRAILFDGTGRKLATASRPVVTFLRGSWIEQDAEEWWAKAVESIREVTDLHGGDVDFCTVTASSACLLPVTESGTPIRRAIMVSDRRAVPQAERMGLLSEFTRFRGRNPSITPDPYYLLPKAMWVAEEEPETHQATRWWLTPGDLLVHRLSGAFVTDPLNAEKFFFEPRANAYPEDLVREAGIDPATLPPVLATGEVGGKVTAAASQATGLKAGTPIVLTTYDAICAFWGSGVGADGDVADVSGTVTSVRVLSRSAGGVADPRIFTQTMPGGDLFVVGGSNNLGGGLIEWLKQSFYADVRSPYELIETEAGASGVGAHGLVFLPYLLGERSPVWDPDARGVLFGLGRGHDRADIARAVCESAAFVVEHILECVRGQGITPRRLRVSGGLARLHIVNAVKADVTGLPVEVVEEFETTAMGAFLMAAAGVGFFPSLESASKLVHVREAVFPDLDRHRCYQELFALYKSVYEQLRPSFAERQRIVAKYELGAPGKLENL